MENTSPIRSTSSGDGSSSTQSEPRRNASTSEPARRKSTISTVLHQPSDMSGKNAKPKQSLLEKATAMWIANTGIDSKTYRSMFKSAVAPTITLALFQVDSFASYYTTQGTAISALISMTAHSANMSGRISRDYHDDSHHGVSAATEGTRLTNLPHY